MTTPASADTVPQASSQADGTGERRLRDAVARLSNRGRWGSDDQLGTLNLLTPEHVVAATRLVTRGRVFSLALPFDGTGPQRGALRRFNPMQFMLRDGDDVYARDLAGRPRGHGASDDVILLASQGGTHWDALAHTFFDSTMWNGYDCRLVSSLGAERNDITNYRDRIVGRGVLIDLARAAGREWLAPGHAVTADDLDCALDAQGTRVGPGDIVLLRFGHVRMCRERGDWGDYAGGDAPGLALDTLDWIADRELAGVAADTWGVEVRPNEISYVNQPWHRVALPHMGLLVGEMFDLEALAADCAQDGVYEMLFTACPLPVTGSVGGPINPVAVK